MLTREESLRFSSQWSIQLNSSGPNGPMAKRSDYQEAVRLKNRLHQESGEVQQERIHPEKQNRTRPNSQFLTMSSDSARIDKRTGWKYFHQLPQVQLGGVVIHGGPRTSGTAGVSNEFNIAILFHMSSTLDVRSPIFPRIPLSFAVVFYFFLF